MQEETAMTEGECEKDRQGVGGEREVRDSKWKKRKEGERSGKKGEFVCFPFHTGTDTGTHTPTHPHTHTPTHPPTHTHTHPHTHIYTDTRTHTHTHAHTWCGPPTKLPLPERIYNVMQIGYC